MPGDGGAEADRTADGATDDPNVLFVCVDCLRGDFVGSDHADTPFVDRLAEDGLSCSSMFATATTTTPAVASVVTGRYSEGNGVHSLDEGSLRDDVDTLAGHFSDAGYETTAMVTGPLVEETGLDRGFDEYRYRDRTEKLIGDWEADAAAAVDDLAAPFFCYLHLWALHKPVEVPPAFDSPEYGDTRYARAFAALDRSLERLCDRLPEDTVVVLHGDHGESITWLDDPVHKLCKYGRMFCRYALGLDTRGIERRLDRFVADRWPSTVPDRFLEDRHGENVYDFVSNVPFVVHGPDVPADSVDAQVRQVDVFPTLLDVVDAPAYADVPADLDGETLLPTDAVEDRDAYVRACGASLLKRENWARAVRADGKKLVVYPERDWSPEFYDLDADPLELEPLADDDAIEAYRGKFPTPELTEGERLEIDDLLADLGYR